MFIELTHATIKDQVVTLVAQKVAGFHRSPALDSTYVYVGEAVFPAKETPEEIKEKLTKANANKGEN